MKVRNDYLPDLVRIVAMTDETVDLRTLRLVFEDPSLRDRFSFLPGQFGQYSVFGVGEAVFTIASSPTRKGYIECSFKLMGKVTTALRDLEVGDLIGFRGPYGNGFPVETLKGRDLLIIGGGVGMAPLKSLIEFCLDNRRDFGEVTILNGARTVADLLYKKEMEEWGQQEGVRVIQTVDPGGETPEWRGKVGLIPNVLNELAPKPDGKFVVVCGPPIMIKFSLQVLDRLGFSPDRVITTMENKMKCGLGKCGRCNIGPVYVCKDGPVFTAADLARLPRDY
ncbi:MAG: FAD/NAD(P)-binding protein [Armatimonadetes bacterium]|nr:FAD/NAD(P)-binding protein [Armatimonadota bacterium]MDW8122328.1 FAD/NAD(P)-binding protein [Armatimonadota bacterium]